MPVTFKIKTPTGSSAEKQTELLFTEKASDLFGEWHDLTARMGANFDKVQDLLAAGRIFGFEVVLPEGYPKTRPTFSTYHLGKSSPLPSPKKVEQASLFETPTDGSIKNMVLERLQEAGEKGTKAAAIRAFIEKTLGRELHYKTIGMTLYRLSERNLARRDGFTWFYVPPKEAENENPGSAGRG